MDVFMNDRLKLRRLLALLRDSAARNLETTGSALGTP